MKFEVTNKTIHCKFPYLYGLFTVTFSITRWVITINFIRIRTLVFFRCCNSHTKFLPFIWTKKFEKCNFKTIPIFPNDLPKGYKNSTRGKVYRKTTAILMSSSSTICTSRFSLLVLSFIVSLLFSILCITWFVTIGDNILSTWFKWDLDNHDLVLAISEEPPSTYSKQRFYKFEIIEL